MSFGLTNTSKAFMDLMNRVFQCYLDSFIVVFIDNLLVYLYNEGDLIGHLRVVLQTIKEYQLFSKYRNYEFWLKSVTFLCHIISSEGVKVDPRKIEAMKNWPRSFIPTDVRSFLRLASYY